MKDEKSELLKVISDEEFESASVRDVMKALYFQVIQSQVIEIEMRNDIKRLNKQVDLLNKALDSKYDVRSAWINITYSYKTSEIIVNNDFRIDFSNTIQTELLSLMFYKKNGKLRPTKWQCAEIAEKFKIKNVAELDTARKVSKVAFRIRDRLRSSVEADLLHVSIKEFFWYFPK